MTNVVTRTDEDALAILQEMRRRAGTLFRALDADGAGVLTPEEIAAAPDVLRALDKDGDGYLRDEDLVRSPHFVVTPASARHPDPTSRRRRPGCPPPIAAPART